MNATLKWKNGKKKIPKVIMISSLRNTIKNIKSFLHGFDRRLNRYEWMHQKFHTEHCTIKEIADIIGCSPDTVQKKLQKHDLLGRDKILDVYTGRFHSSKHFIMRILKNRYIDKIEKPIDEIYPRITSRNPLIFKEILDEMEKLDQDTGTSSGGVLGMSRKETFILGGKFGICLFDYDSQYEERIDWFLREVIRRKDEFFFDESSDPENWYPNRSFDMWAKHFFAKRTKVGEQIFFINASDATIKHEDQTDRWFNSLKKKKETP